jgi:hypothetical protein
MELSPPWEATNCVATQELPSNLWNPKVHYRVHKSPPLVPILRQIDSVHTTPSCLSKIHFNIHPPTSFVFLSGLLPSGFPTDILHAFLFSYSCYIPCLSHPPWLDHSNYTWHRVQVMKLLIMQFSPTHHFICLQSKYSSQHPVFEHPQSLFLL